MQCLDGKKIYGKNSKAFRACQSPDWLFRKPKGFQILKTARWAEHFGEGKGNKW
jgi:hypothetical protein